MYSAKVMDHFMNPRNVGEIENPDGVGEVERQMWRYHAYLSGYRRRYY